MSRISNTRFRTREAAARLVAAGRRPHELTVDLIYAEIRQGSRTTINDELKLWKDEQARVDALSAALPPAVANAMLSSGRSPSSTVSRSSHSGAKSWSRSGGRHRALSPGNRQPGA
jgi:hypothetical protein